MPTSNKSEIVHKHRKEGRLRCCDDACGEYRTEKSDRQTELVCANVDTKRTGGTSGTNDVRRRNRSGELPSCGNAQSASAVWSGVVSGLQSEYARARNTAGTKSTYDAWQLHEESHKEGGE